MVFMKIVLISPACAGVGMSFFGGLLLLCGLLSNGLLLFCGLLMV